MNTGKNFEDLVAWIEKYLHANAKIIQNDKRRDKQTGQLRQIDLGITIKEGPTEIYIMVEARDRSKPVGVGYIEETHSKMQAVKADACIIISKSGFCETALKKAEDFGIRTYSVDDAIAENPNRWLIPMSLTKNMYDDSKVDINVKLCDLKFNFTYEEIKKLRLNSPDFKFFDKNGNLLVNQKEFVNQIVNEKGLSDFIYNKTVIEIDKKYPIKIDNIILSTPIFFIGDDDLIYEIIGLKLFLEAYKVRQIILPNLLNVVDKIKNEKHAEIMSWEFKVGEEKYKFELMANADFPLIKAGPVSYRHFKVKEE